MQMVPVIVFSEGAAVAKKAPGRAQGGMGGKSGGREEKKRGPPEKTKWGDYRGEWLCHLWVAFVCGGWVGKKAPRLVQKKGGTVKKGVGQGKKRRGKSVHGPTMPLRRK